jgi:Domain of unknown function (DUF4437)
LGRYSQKNVPSGVLLKFAGGFSSPPHIHNITYRAVVISGAAHNDDPEAANMWMGPGSFWTQPAGEVHITSAQSGPGATAFLEILEGPYLVQPPHQAFDNGERPLNLEERNVVWLTPNDITWISQTENAVAEDECLFYVRTKGTYELKRIQDTFSVSAALVGQLYCLASMLLLALREPTHSATRCQLKRPQPTSAGA